MMGENRRKQIAWIIGLTAVTMMPQYALQGWLATGGDPSTLPDLAWQVDAGAWAIRAIVEAWVLMYLFATQPKTDEHARWLKWFEVALIALITVTLGPALYAIGSRLPINEALPGWAYWAWSFGVASYAPLMLGAAGFAWRVEQAQPETHEAQPPRIAAKLPRITAPKAAYTCDVCGATYEKQQSLAAHSAVHKRELTEVATNGKT